jgi:hypothetical protein
MRSQKTKHINQTANAEKRREKIFTSRSKQSAYDYRAVPSFKNLGYWTEEGWGAYPSMVFTDRNFEIKLLIAVLPEKCAGRTEITFDGSPNEEGWLFSNSFNLDQVRFDIEMRVGTYLYEKDVPAKIRVIWNAPNNFDAVLKKLHRIYLGRKK